MPRLFEPRHLRASVLHMRLATYFVSSRVGDAVDGAPRLRRLLCLGRKARSPRISRPTGDRRGWCARRRHHLLLHRPHLWGSLGHADVQGPEGLPASYRHQSRLFEVSRREPAHHGHDARLDSPGAATVTGRGLDGSVWHRAVAWRASRRHPGPVAGPRGGRGRDHRFHRTGTEQVPSEDRV